MDTIRFFCGHCGELIELHVAYAGMVGKCSQCGTGFITPQVARFVPPVAVVPGLRSAPIEPPSIDPNLCAVCSGPLDSTTGQCDACEMQKAATAATPIRRTRRVHPSPSWTVGKIIGVSAFVGVAVAFLIVAIMYAQSSTQTEKPPVQPHAIATAPPIPPEIAPAIAPRDNHNSKPNSIFDTSGQHFNNPKRQYGPTESVLPDAPTSPTTSPTVPSEPADNPKIKTPGHVPVPRLAPLPPDPNADLKDKINIAIAQQRRDDALELMGKLQRLEPDNEQNVVRMAEHELEGERSNPMRAARVLKDYLAKHPGKEEAQNALGTALARVDSDKWGSVYWDLKHFYADYDDALAQAKNDGNARWGTEWIFTAQAAEKWHDAIEAQHDLTSAVAAKVKADMDLARLKQQRDDASRSNTGARDNVYEFDAAIRQATFNVISAQKNIRSAELKCSKSQPNFPSRIDWRKIDS